MKIRNQLLAGVGLLVLSVSVSRANPMTTCPSPTTLDTYLANGFSCVVDNVMLTDFTFSSNGSMPITASTIDVQPVPNTQGLYFPFTPSLTVSSPAGGGSDSTEFTFGFNMEALNGLTLNAFNVDFNGSGAHGGGSTVTTTLCVNHSVAGCPADQVLVAGSVPPDPATVSVGLPNANTIGVSFDVNVFSGDGGSGSLVQFEFGTVGGSGVPEPSSIVLCAGALAVIFVRLRHRNQTNMSGQGVGRSA